MIARLFAPRLFVAISASLAVLLASSLVPAGEKEDSDKELLRGAQQVFLENREGFNRCKIVFSCLTGETDSLENAISGKLIHVTKKQNCLFIAHDKYFRYERRHDISSSDNVKLTEHELLTLSDGGKAALGLDYSASIANVAPMSGDALGNTALTPFDLTIMGPGERTSPAKLIGRYLALKSDPTKCEIVGSEEIFETTCVKLEIHKASGGRAVYLLDESRGYLPRKVTLFKSDNSIVRTVFVPKVEQVKNGHWISKQIVAIDSFSGRIPVMMLEVGNVEVNQEFKLADFSLSVPEGCVVFSAIGNSKGIRLPPKIREINVQELPSLLDGTYLQNHATSRLLINLAMTICTVLIVTCVIYVQFFRRRTIAR